MTLVFRNRLDPDNGRQIGLPVVSVTTVAALKSALLTAGTYTVSPGLYVADLVANVDDVHLICLPGVIFRPLTSVGRGAAYPRQSLLYHRHLAGRRRVSDWL